MSKRRKYCYAMYFRSGVQKVVYKWEECQQEMEGTSGTLMQGFMSTAQAWQWLHYKAKKFAPTYHRGMLPDLVRMPFAQQRWDVVNELMQDAGYYD